MSTPRIIFAGTPAFAHVAMKALVDAGLIPVAVLTQPDRPAGRGRKLTASPVKKFATQLGIPVLQPQTLRDDEAHAALEALRPDVMIVAAYGLLLPQAVLDIPRHGCLNVHASLLPRWRGAAPIQAAILAGDNNTGVSLMAMTAGLDCGPVYAEQRIEIAPNETAGELHDRLAAAGGKLLVAELQTILDGERVAVEQDEGLATYAGKIQKQDAEIDWRRPATEIHRAVRAYNPVPGAYFFHAENRIKIWRAAVATGVSGNPGEILQFSKDAIVIACGEDGLRLEELQMPGKRRAVAREFVDQADFS